MTFFFPFQAGAEPVGRGAGQQPRRVQIRARGLHLLTHRHGPAARAEHATPAGLLVCPGTRLETPNLQQKASGPTFWLALQTSDGQEGGLPWRFGTAGCRAVATGRVSVGVCSWKTLAGWGRDGPAVAPAPQKAHPRPEKPRIVSPRLESWGHLCFPGESLLPLR